MNRLLRKLMILPFVLSVVAIDFDGCWRPITAALSEIGIDVSTHGDAVSVDLFGNQHDDDDD
jgi:hypothetical protein